MTSNCCYVYIFSETVSYKWSKYFFELVSFNDLRNDILGIRIYALSGQLLVLLLQLFSHGGCWDLLLGLNGGNKNGKVLHLVILESLHIQMCQMFLRMLVHPQMIQGRKMLLMSSFSQWRQSIFWCFGVQTMHGCFWINARKVRMSLIALSVIDNSKLAFSLTFSANLGADS